MRAGWAGAGQTRNPPAIRNLHKIQTAPYPNVFAKPPIHARFGSGRAVWAVRMTLCPALVSVLFPRFRSLNIYFSYFWPPSMADEEEDEENNNNDIETISPTFPNSRVKKIMKLDKDINKVNSEALFLISCSTDLFLQFLAEKSARVAIEKKRKTIKLEHLRVAVKRHQPTSDFLLDSLPMSSQPADRPPEARTRSAEKPVPAGTRRIDDFFQKGS
ncbi:hypothetical protein HYC85_010764 [Camellia sinensis]|uniref:Transcription factor CBF/NF-Y/archaeal histone domain-containing protein n=2 Tax=Camellia sinensis TaxID=4442 RepID=A0A7J7HIT7_CAMSI|nr:hypothetical protein HYC85_010764 [Camellia sinensis]